MSDRKPMMLVRKKLVYPVLAMKPAETAAGSPLPGQWMATVQDVHTKQPFYLLLNAEVLQYAGFELMQST